jgi:hypothetical protein
MQLFYDVRLSTESGKIKTFPKILADSESSTVECVEYFESIRLHLIHIRENIYLVVQHLIN